MQTPNQCFYSKNHIWVKTVENGLLVGVTDFAQSNMGPIEYIDLPQVGEKLIKDSSYGCAESSKSVSEMFAPLNALVVEVNTALDSNPEIVNDSPYEEGWMLRITDYAASDLALLLNADAYKELVN